MNPSTIALTQKTTGRRKFSQSAMFGLFRVAAVVNGLALFVILFFLVKNGWRAINYTFLTQPPINSMTQGGILPCIVGTVYLSIGAKFPPGLPRARLTGISGAFLITS